MPEDYVDLRTVDNQEVKPKGDAGRSSWWIGRWAHVIAGAVFCVLYFPFASRIWSWQVAVTLSYVVFMLCCTCGLAFRDSDDFFGDLQVPRYIAVLMLRQAVVLISISIGAYLWHHFKTLLPLWATYEGRRMSLWDLCGLVVAYWVAVKEASWIAERIKQQFPRSLE